MVSPHSIPTQPSPANYGATWDEMRLNATKCDLMGRKGTQGDELRLIRLPRDQAFFDGRQASRQRKLRRQGSAVAQETRRVCQFANRRFAWQTGRAAAKQLVPLGCGRRMRDPLPPKPDDPNAADTRAVTVPRSFIHPEINSFRPTSPAPAGHRRFARDVPASWGPARWDRCPGREGPNPFSCLVRFH
jgi:hypothetical protein